MERPPAAAEGQYWLLPPSPARWRGRHARHHHGRRAETRTTPGRSVKWRCAPCQSSGGGGSLCSAAFSGVTQAPLQAFEYISGAAIALAAKHIPGVTVPIESRSPRLRAGRTRDATPGFRIARRAREGAGGRAGIGRGGQTPRSRRARRNVPATLENPRGASLMHSALEGAFCQKRRLRPRLSRAGSVAPRRRRR